LEAIAAPSPLSADVDSPVVSSLLPQAATPRLRTSASPKQAARALNRVVLVLIE
jgi:hypothetical protein